MAPVVQPARIRIRTLGSEGGRGESCHLWWAPGVFWVLLLLLLLLVEAIVFCQDLSGGGEDRMNFIRIACDFAIWT